MKPYRDQRKHYDFEESKHSKKSPPITWGVNPAKRSMQRFVLGRILRHPHNKGPYTVLCMPGETCWDVDYFSSFDRVARVIVIERDPEVAAIIRNKTEGNHKVEIYEESVSTFLMNTPDKIDILYLDYYSNLNLSVLQDIRLIFQREIVPLGGKIVVGFLGARETPSAQVGQQLLFDHLNSYAPCGEEWDAIEADRRRCIAFNALVASHRTQRSPMAPKGEYACHNKTFNESGMAYTTTTGPLWHRYKTETASMLTGVFSINRRTKTSSPGTVRAAMDVWYVRNNWRIRDWRRQNMSGLGKTEGSEFVRLQYKKEILRFYEKHHYTPTIKQLSRTMVRDWRGIIREVGLCPRSGASLSEIQAELQRIVEREGVITWKLLKIAHLTKRGEILKIGSGNSIVGFRHLCDEMDIPHTLIGEATAKRDDFRETVINDWLLHLQSSRARMAFPHYRMMARLRLLVYKDAHKALQVLRLRPPRETG